MHRIPFFLGIVCLTLTVRAQKLAPSMGDISKEDLQIATCDFDPEADAYILFKTGESSFILGTRTYLQTIYRFRIKILTDKGVNRGNMAIPYYSKNGLQSIEDVKGMTYNLDEQGNIVMTKLDKSSVYNKEVSKDYSAVSFALPEVKKGSVIEFTYTKLSQYYTDIDNWYFQEDIPIRYCSFSLSVSRFFDFSYHVHQTLPIHITDLDGREAGKQFVMQNIPGLREEPYMSSAKDYLQRIDFQLASINLPGRPEEDFHSSWEKINEEELDRETFGGQLRKNLKHPDGLDARIKALPDSTDRMLAVYKVVKETMEWDRQDRRSAEDIKKAWEDKRGSTADINLILIDLLRDYHIRAYPVLVSTRHFGRANPLVTLLSQFNEVYAYVLIGDKDYVLNASQRYEMPQLIPSDVQYSAGFIVDRDRPGWVDLSDDDKAFQIDVGLTARITDNGVLKGTALVDNYDYGKVPRLRRLDEGMELFKTTYFSRAYPRITIDSLSVTGQDNDSMPLQQHVEFSARLNRSGDYVFFVPNIFIGQEKNPFTAEHRFSDVDFGYRQIYRINGSVDIPDNYEIDTVPRNIRMIMADTSIVLERLMQVDDHKVSYRILLEFKRPLYTADMYDDFREFYKKLYGTVNEPVVLRKKTP